LSTEKADAAARSYYRTAEREHERLKALEARIRRAKNIYLGAAALIMLVALGVGFLVDRNLGLVGIMVAALVVFAGAMYVSRIFRRGA